MIQDANPGSKLRASTGGRGLFPSLLPIFKPQPPLYGINICPPWIQSSETESDAASDEYLANFTVLIFINYLEALSKCFIFASTSFAL